MTKTRSKPTVEDASPHWIEWLTGLVSAVIVLVVIAWIGKDALTDRDSSPDLQGVALQTERRSEGFQVLFEMRNRSSATAADVVVHGEIRTGDTVVETARTILDYVPGRSQAKGGLIFQSDPTDKTLTISASAFSEP